MDSSNFSNRVRFLLCCSILLAALGGYQQAMGAGSQSRVLITQTINETELVTLAGNTRSEATAANDRGPVADDFPMDHTLLQLRRAPEQEQALKSYIDGLTDPKSPNFHQWLNSGEVGVRYGLAAQDLATITNWLKSHDFTINQVYLDTMVIDFSGTAGQVQKAFHTEIHNLDVNGKLHVANMSDPEIPAALAPAVVGVVSLNNFPAQPQYRVHPNYSYACNTLTTKTCNAVAPADLAKIYHLKPLFSQGISGLGRKIVVVESSDVYNAKDFKTFRRVFGLATAFPHGRLTTVHPGGCTDPEVVPEVEFEATIDAEWADAAAPNATIELASCASTNASSGVVLALENLLSGSGTPPAIVSNSYGVPETLLGSTGNSAMNNLYQMAAAKGVSVFVASGDAGAAYADQFFVRNMNEPVASLGIAVNGYASTPYNVAVGSTDFGDVYAGTSSTYWNTKNTSAHRSARSYVPEITWNDSCTSSLVASFLGFEQFGPESICQLGDLINISAGSGGPSLCAKGAPSIPGVYSGNCAGYPKPAWQSVLGNPADGVRDLPDVSLFASDGNFPSINETLWGHSYTYCDTDTSDGFDGCKPGAGGTSFASPIMAGIQALINEHTGSRHGNPNPTYYSLARAEYGTSGSSSCNSSNGNAPSSRSCIFHDVTLGDNDVPCCAAGLFDCEVLSGTDNFCYVPAFADYGVLSLSNSEFRPAFDATTGWDFATGIGSVNAYNLVMAFR
jgi:subtilase family serine protease